MRLNDEELELVSIARGQNIDEMVAVVEHIVAARLAEAPAVEITQTLGEPTRCKVTRYRCCPHCQDDTVHDVETDGHELPCNAPNSTGCLGRVVAAHAPEPTP